MHGRQGAGLVAFFLAVVAGVYVILLSGRPPLEARLGEPAPRDFTAGTSFECRDIAATRAARERARLRTPLVLRRTTGKFEASARALLSALAEGEAGPLWERIEDASLREEMQRLLPALRGRKGHIEEALLGLGRMPLVSPLEWGRNAPWRPEQIAVRDGPASEEEILVSAREVIPLSGTSESFGAAFEKALGNLSDERRALALRAFAAVLHPTMEMDRELTQRRAEAEEEAQKPVMEHVAKGTLILRKGTVVLSQHLAELEADREHYWQSKAGRRLLYQRMVGLAVVLLILAGAGGVHLVRHCPELLRSRLQRLSFGLLTLALVGVARLFVVLGVPVLLVPVPLVVIVLCLVYDQRFGFETAVLYGLLVGLAQRGADTGFIILMLGGMTAALLTGNVRTRTTLIKAGLIAGLAQLAAVWGLALLAPEGVMVPHLRFWESALFLDSLCALGNGVVSGVLVSGLLPGIEGLFGITTNIRLLEWSDPNQPLMQRLLLEAPGTYHHSMLVGSLSAEAAESIGANPLLARVGAYFHDVGKLKNPEYFEENIPADQRNPHDDLSPSMSRLIICAHPRDGQEEARRHGLPREVSDIILQSHGTSMMKYFWGRAKQQSAENEEPEERSFRYRLPKPQSKEAACIMFADAAESASRSLESPSAARIEEQVHGILLDRLHDGQLDESGLSITDLHRIERILVRGLTAVFHRRAPYPEQEGKEQRAPAEQHEKASNRSSQPTG